MYFMVNFNNFLKGQNIKFTSYTIFNYLLYTVHSSGKFRFMCFCVSSGSHEKLELKVICMNTKDDFFWLKMLNLKKNK